MLGSLPIPTDKYCLSQETRVYALNVLNDNNTSVGVFNFGAKYNLEGEEEDEATLNLTVDEK